MVLRHPLSVVLALLLPALAARAAAPSTPAADAVAGKAVFRAQCALCHSAEAGDNGGAQGPSLIGVVGRKAAAAPGFSYTEALRTSRLTWNAPTLDRFLAAPMKVVPGTSMVIPLEDAADRRNVIAYFEAVAAGTFKDAPPRAAFALPPPTGAPAKGEADWKKDAPGRVHRIDLDTLPKPFDTPSASNFPRLVPRPADAPLHLPPGFKAEVFAKDLPAARNMAVAPNGDIFLSQTLQGRISVLRPSADGSRAETVFSFATGLNLPLGIQFQPAGDAPRWLYVAETNRVVRYAYTAGATQAAGVPEVVVPRLYDSKAAGHYTRDLAFSRDGTRMYVSVGSESNVAEHIGRKSVEEAQAWEREQGIVGAPWGSETRRAAVLVYDVARPGNGRIFASGIRNCVGLTVQPATDEVWCTTNERDLLGDDLVPDYSTRVKEGGFYGWPWYYMGSYEDPRHAGARPDLADKALRPDVPFQAHSAADSLVFYPQGQKGASAFPPEFHGDGFAVLHGSWNRAFRTGHKVVRLPMKDGVPTGDYVDFMTGMITADGNAWGRPVAATVAKDGSLLVSDDGTGTVYRISYAAPRTVALPGERVFPESLSSTPDGTLYVGSIGARTIYRALPGAGAAEAWIGPGADAPAGYLGVLADQASGTLWACALPQAPPAGPASPSRLFAYDLTTGKAKGNWPLPGPGAACNDIALGADGTAYITDTTNMEVLRLRPGAKALEPWAGADGAFGAKGQVLDGIAVLGDRVVVNVLISSTLYAVPVQADGSAGKATAIKLDLPIDRPDGMRAIGPGRLLVAEGGSAGVGRLSRIDIHGDTGTVTPLQQGFPDTLVAVTAVGGTAWLLESQFAAMRAAPGTPARPFKVTSAPLH
ncbi:MAG: hypothetical protein RL026_492 [Pseudomonadota bacterium]